ECACGLSHRELLRQCEELRTGLQPGACQHRENTQTKEISMKRFHVHVAVDDLRHSVRFYSTLFAAEPTMLKPDYAKWMLEDPRVNFAISATSAISGHGAGISHLGIQAEDEGELAEVYDRLAQAERPVSEEKAATCCY